MKWTRPPRAKRLAGLQRVSGLSWCVVFSLLLASACGFNRAEGPSEEAMVDPTIEEVQVRHTPKWMELPGVVGTGIGRCDDREPCIRVFLSAPSPEAAAAIPERIEGFRVELLFSGPFWSRDAGTAKSP